MANFYNSSGKKILLAYALGVVAFTVTRFTPFSIPCVFYLITGIPCPGCGMTRAVTLFLRQDLLGAITMNILFLPLLLGSIAYVSAAVVEVATKKEYVKRLNHALNRKWIIGVMAVLMLASWVYNLMRWA